MPQTRVLFYREATGEVPVLNWLRELRRKDPEGYAKCVARVKLLAELGHRLRRPIADTLRDGIYELRARKRRVNYRLLYFFYGKHVAILAHALTKEAEVPDIDIERAIARKRAVENDPETHTAEEELSEEEHS